MARKKSDIPTIPWTADRSALVWKLLGELAKKDNHAALYGVQKGNNTIGSSKTKIHKAIAQALFPDIYPENEDTLASRIKGKIEDLHTRYKAQRKRLTVTGGGLGGNDAGEVQSPPEEEHLACYIPAEGPDETTTSDARNLWEKINEEFPFFAEMHRYLCGRPNAIPPVVTTGVGPEGRRVVHYQSMGENSASQPESTPSSSDSQPTISVTPAHSHPSSSDKENEAPASAMGKKRGPKESSFAITDAAVEQAKGSIQRVSKRSFEDRLAEATEASLKSATERAAASHRLEKRRLVLEELMQIGKKRDQIIALHTAKLYSSRQARRELQKLEEREAVLQPPLKRGRVRSPSPVSSILQQSSPLHFPSSPDWNITNGNSLPSESSDI